MNILHRHSLPPHVTRQKRASKNHHTYSCHTLRARTDAYLHSFLPGTLRAWNNLPLEIVLAPSPESFRAQLANKLSSSTGSGLTHTDDWQISVPGPMKYRDVTGNTDLSPITMRKITQFLQPLGTSLNKNAQELYDER